PLPVCDRRDTMLQILTLRNGTCQMKRFISAALLIPTFLLFSLDLPAQAADARLANTERFVVTYVNSSNVESCPRILTAITVVNNSASSCRVRVDLFASSTPG